MMPSEAMPVESRPAALKASARTGGINCHRSKRASSCPRSQHGGARDPVAVETRGRAPKETTKARAAAASGDLKTTGKARGTACKLQTRAQSRPAARGAAQPQNTPSTRSHTHCEIHSHKAFTVFAPNPKKRQDIQRKAEAELAALEDLRLSKAMGYVSISPSAVGGSLTLEEVRKKQQQEMQTQRRQKQTKKYVLGTSPMAVG
ncbi:uncharacterized protein zgc:194621 [Astyanax mexicanus]|uniref:uncharacterized protein zgc:194621 n=1 Tax=Astyanax mexicanus TaxID=7994 RepID=UPI0020CAB240|nr:uncharacterized protein zgc:194621 [Astyanax mexicanus]